MKIYSLLSLILLFMLLGCDEEKITYGCGHSYNEPEVIIDNSFTVDDTEDLLSRSNSELYALAVSRGIGKCVVVKSLAGGKEDLKTVFILRLDGPDSCRDLYFSSVTEQSLDDARNDVVNVMRGYIENGVCFSIK